MRKQALVTGGAGFLGSHLSARLLQEGWGVIALDDLSTGARENLEPLLRNPHFTFVHGDVTVPFRFLVDEVYHLACPASPEHYQRDPVRTLRTCFEGTRNALELGREVRARVFLASTSETYGEPLEHPQTESYRGNVSTTGPRACYDEGKRAAEALAYCYARQHGSAVRVARIFNTYGPSMRFDDGRVVSNFILQALEGRLLTLAGDGSQTRSFCYVDDLVLGILRLMRSGVADPVNLGNPEEVTVKQLALEVLRVTRGLDAAREDALAFRPLPGDDPSRRRPDISRAVTHLGWRPAVSLAEGLRRTVEDFRTRLAAERAPSAYSPLPNMSTKRKTGGGAAATEAVPRGSGGSPPPAVRATELVRLEALRPHPRNYRRHPEAQLAHIVESLKRHGFYRNVVIAREGTILAGHGVVEASRRAGLTEVPVYRLDLAPEDPLALKVLTGDNELSRFAETDDRALTEILRDVMNTDEEGLLGTGYDEAQLAALLMTTRPASEIQGKGAAGEWVGMPEYDEGGKPIQLVVTFLTEADRARFVKEQGMRIDKKAGVHVWSTRWPFVEREDVAGVVFRGAKK